MCVFRAFGLCFLFVLIDQIDADAIYRISHSPACSLPALLCTRSLSRNNKPNSSSLVCASAYSEVQFIIH